MVVILVHWLIRKGHEDRFTDRWREMTVESHSGLYREILTKLDITAEQDTKFHTFSVGDPFYSTFINIGIWHDLDSFDAAIGWCIPDVKVEDGGGRRVQTVELEEFEFKLRERVVLEVIGTRGGALPPANVN
jgi:hypothetical protein